MHSRSVNALVKEKRNRIEFELTESVYKRAKCERAHILHLCLAGTCVLYFGQSILANSQSNSTCTSLISHVTPLLL